MMNVSNSLAQYSLSRKGFRASGGPKVGARAFSEALQYWAGPAFDFLSEWNILQPSSFSADSSEAWM